MSRAVTTEEMEARYLTNESGERIGVVLDVAEYERLRRSAEKAESNIPEDRLDAVHAYPDEIEQKIKENNRPPEYWRERYPNLNIQSIKY